MSHALQCPDKHRMLLKSFRLHPMFHRKPPKYFFYKYWCECPLLSTTTQTFRILVSIVGAGDVETSMSLCVVFRCGFVFEVGDY